MNANKNKLPKFVGNMFSLLPAYPGSFIFASGLNFIIANHLPLDVQTLMNKKKFRIRVVDAQLTFDFRWRQGKFEACIHDTDVDLTIAASAHDFTLLVRREEDPDTLFFNRRLTMDGDTDLGLLVKNTLDALDPAVFDWRTLTPQRMFSRRNKTNT